MHATRAAAAICSAFVLSAPAYSQVQLKIANYFPPPSQQAKTTQAFGEELEKRSGGKIKVQHFAGGSLLTGPNMFKGIQSGIADIGYSHVYYTPGVMPVSEAIGLPIGIPTGWVGGHVGNDFYDKFKPKEFASVKMLSLHSNGPSLVISKRPVSKLEDLKGLTIRAPGITGEIAKALGATPTPTPMMEVYDSIAKGVNEAVLSPYETLRTFRFAEVAKHVTVNWQTGGSFPFFMVMNKRSYDALPAQEKKVLDAVTAEYQERFARMWNDIDVEGRAFAKEKGVSYIELSDQEAARWQKAVEPVIAGYVKSMAGKGYPEAQTKAHVAFLRERSAYWTKQQLQRKIAAATGPVELRPEALAK
jgi:TRAP-type C4-dicarboxylate transport system substrate-binding protein